MLLENLAEYAKCHGDSRIRVREGDWVVERTFSQCLQDVDHLIARLTSLGIERGHVIGIELANAYYSLVWDLAAVNIGAVLQPLTAEQRRADPEELVRRYGLACVVDEECGRASLEPGASLVCQNRLDTSVPTCDEDAFSRVYSSGTTGRPKGIEISRKGTEHVISRFLEAFDLRADDSHLLFLPLANFQQRLIVYGCLCRGASIAICPYQCFFEECRVVRPTFLVAPPLFYQTLLTLAGDASDEPTLAQTLGGRIRFMLTGMARISTGIVEEFLRRDLLLLEAYGMTECGMITWNTPGNRSAGTVGRPVEPGLVSIGEDSEVFVRSRAPLSRRYFEASEEDSAAVYRADGRIATGDIGVLRDGYLQLVGRKKDLLVTSSGEKFHPSEIEKEFRLDGGAQQCVAVNCASDGAIALFVIVNDGRRAAPEDFVDRVRAVNVLLNPSRRVRRIVVAPVADVVSRGLLTDNMKLNRTRIAAALADAADVRNAFRHQDVR